MPARQTAMPPFPFAAENLDSRSETNRSVTSPMTTENKAGAILLATRLWSFLGWTNSCFRSEHIALDRVQWARFALECRPHLFNVICARINWPHGTRVHHLLHSGFAGDLPLLQEACRSRDGAGH